MASSWFGTPARFRIYLTLVVESFVTSFVLANILGWSMATFAKLWLLASLNVFSIPLIHPLLGPGFPFPPWAWYVIVLTWVGKMALIYYSRRAVEGRMDAA